MRPWLAGLLLGAAACAQPGTPPGGEIDRSPPRVIGVTPEPFDTIRDLSRPVVFRFDERLSERLEGVAELRDAVLVSPETGEVRADRGRRSVEVSLAGGWREGLVYRVVVLPVFRDLFQNLRVEPSELVFSTGAPILESAVAGFVSDRITGEAVVGARIRATRRSDDITYVAVTDSAGFFAVRHAPAGDYDLSAWQDVDRDRERDFFEPGDSSQVALAVGDTAVLELRLLPGDTTPARLARAEPLDSVTIRLLFDDHFAPGTVGGSGDVMRAEDSTHVAAGRLLHGTRLDSLRAARSEPADTVGADTAAVAEPGVQPAPAEPPPARRQAAPASDSEPLPSRELLLLLQAPLAPESVYYVVVEGVTNINGVPGGGGSARFQMPSAPPPPSPDTAAVPVETTGAPRGTSDAGRPPHWPTGSTGR